MTNQEELEVEEDVLEDGARARGAGAAEPGAGAAGASTAAGPAPAAPDAASSSPAGESSAPGSELSALRAEFDALNDRHLRLAAEFNNFRRRSEQERLQAWSRAQAEVIAKVLDVLDDVQRVAHLDLGNATVDAIMEGIDLVERKFGRVLEDSSVEIIDPLGQAFDPEVMEAVMRLPAEREDQVDTVAQVFQKGYSLKGVLVRPARVSVHTPA